MNCKYCNNEFIKNHHAERYCSDFCRQNVIIEYGIKYREVNRNKAIENTRNWRLKNKKYKSLHIPRKCKTCRKLFLPTTTGQKYCNTICYKKYNTNIFSICESCYSFFVSTNNQKYCNNECRKVAMKKYQKAKYLENREKLKKYYSQNREKIKEYYLENRERKLKYQNAYNFRKRNSKC